MRTHVFFQDPNHSYQPRLGPITYALPTSESNPCLTVLIDVVGRASTTPHFRPQSVALFSLMLTSEFNACLIDVVGGASTTPHNTRSKQMLLVEPQQHLLTRVCSKQPTQMRA